ncbi:MAG: nickel pincer cofactor biosynthesis protein LarC [Anaerolineales bacterium]|nr:nickel pincer cofactor biosynthesis protein LarC [Anaerolineales bacterium]
MKTIAYFDCYSGISGNMALGALMDCGVAPDSLKAELHKLNLGGYRLEVREAEKSGLRGLFVDVPVEEKQPHRHLRDIEEIILRGGFTARIRERSLAVFRRLAEAESRVHGEAVEKIHFHEVGAVDAIVDIVGTAICLEILGVENVYASPLHIGAGTVQSAHGLLPVPAPATAELLRGVPVYGRDVEAELVTPTGAALLAGLAAEFGAAPPMRVERVGYGAGTRDLPWANLLRVTIGAVADREPSAARELVVEANIDDMNPQWYEHVTERLFAAGALDVYLTPIHMKRNRPAVMLGMLVEETRLDPVLGILFAETTTIGVRIHPVERRKLDREEKTVETPYGTVRVKNAKWEGRVMNAAPEYRDCLRLAEEKNVPLKEVWQAALAAARAMKK